MWYAIGMNTYSAQKLFFISAASYTLVLILGLVPLAAFFLSGGAPPGPGPLTSFVAFFVVPVSTLANLVGLVTFIWGLAVRN